MADEAARSDRELREDLKQLRIVDDAAHEPRTGERPARPAPRRRRRPLRWILGLVVVGAGALYGYQQTRPAVPEAKLVPVTRRDVGVPPVVLTAVGYVVPRREIVVSSNVQGKIIEMPIEENDQVRAGDVLVRLDDEQVRANLRLTEAQAADARRELELTRKLFERGVRPRSVLDRVETAYEIAKARVEQVRVALDDMVLRAPFDGTVVRKLRDVGEFLTLGVTAEGDPGTSAVVLADLDRIDVELEINETEIRKVAPGMVALVIPEALPQKRYLADVIDVASRADRRKGVVPVRVRIRDPDGALLPEMTAKVRFLSRAPATEIRVRPSVPSSALARRDGRTVVFVVDDESRVRPVPVVVDEASRAADPPGYAAVAIPGGAQQAVPTTGDGAEVSYVALLEGPAEGVYVLENPTPGLEPGSRVQIAQ